MSLQITEKKTDFSDKELSSHSHVMVLMPKAKTLPALPGVASLKAALKRRAGKIEELAKSPVSVEVDGTLIVYAMLDGGAPTFERHTQIRKAWECLSGEKPESVAVAVSGDMIFRKLAGHDAAYVLAVNAEPLPARKSKSSAKALKKATLYGVTGCNINAALATAEGNTLTRSLTVLPPNELTPGEYRKRIKALAKTYGWTVEEFGFDKLKKMGKVEYRLDGANGPAFIGESGNYRKTNHLFGTAVVVTF
jgi:leucyl aminopeptidase